MPQSFHASRPLTALEQNNTIVAVIEMSKPKWLLYFSIRLVKVKRFRAFPRFVAFNVFRRVLLLSGIGPLGPPTMGSEMMKQNNLIGVLIVI
ncbi:hypothetical protein [Mesorhizobium sp. M0140]|uniref:hypothetical protein n=1 Tax=Mesorhizobium sp. M0140 TaxID=2956893 RepID=UPI00333CB2D4